MVTAFTKVLRFDCRAGKFRILVFVFGQQGKFLQKREPCAECMFTA